MSSRRIFADREVGDDRGKRRLREWDREYQLLVALNAPATHTLGISDISGLQEALDALDGRIDVLEETVDDLQDQIDAITGATHYLTLIGGGRLALADLSGFLRME